MYGAGGSPIRMNWTHNANEQADLEGRGFDQLNWAKRLRLHHLVCLQRLQPGPARTIAAQKCKAMAQTLIAADSPFRGQTALIWQAQPDNAEGDKEPDLQGNLLNPSLTHIGCLEIYRLDPANQPNRIDFIAFDELAGIKIAPPGLIRPAKLFYNDGRDEIVLLPLLYGTSWIIGDEYDRAGEMTRFVAHVDDNENLYLCK